MRFHLGSASTPIIPVKYGIFGLYDTVRVWFDNDVSNEWHYSYVGGFYIVPWQNAFTIEFTYAISDQKDLIFFFSFGKPF